MSHIRPIKQLYYFSLKLESEKFYYNLNDKVYFCTSYRLVYFSHSDQHEASYQQYNFS